MVNDKIIFKKNKKISLINVDSLSYPSLLIVSEIFLHAQPIINYLSLHLIFISDSGVNISNIESILLVKT